MLTIRIHMYPFVSILDPTNSLTDSIIDKIISMIYTQNYLTVLNFILAILQFFIKKKIIIFIRELDSILYSDEIKFSK